MTLTIRKAERRRAKARIGLCGPAGSGKTHSALLLASGLGSKIALIDTENGSGELESGKPNIPDYDVVTISAPFDVQKYINAINELGKLGYDVIIIDSLSHAWAGTGGLLDKQAEASKRLGNSYTAWRDVTPQHNALVDTILQSPSHVIATMRSKTEYVLELNDKGKQIPRKVGMAPVQREGMDYEFTLVFDIDQATHSAAVSKDRTSLFDGQLPHKISSLTGECVLEWLNGGAEPVAQLAESAPEQTAWDKSPEGLDLIESFRDMVRVLSTDDQGKWIAHLLNSPSLRVAQERYSTAKSKLSTMAA